MSFKDTGSLIKETFKEFGEDRVLRLSAAMAYYTVFAIGPLLVLIVGLAGLIMGEEQVRHTVTQQLQGTFGEKSAKLVESMMTSNQKSGSLMATIVGGIGLLLGAAGVFGQLQDALNTIWEVKAKPGIGIAGFIRQRFLSMAMVLGTGFLLLISMVLTAVVNAFTGYIGQVMSLPSWIAQVLNEGASLMVIVLLFALIFKILPDVKIPWRPVWIGALVTAVLFTAGKFVLGWYLGRQASASAYGAGTAFVLILLYIYYSSLILFLGAEFTQVYTRRISRVVPSKYAVSVTDHDRAEEGAPHSGSKPAPERGTGKAASKEAATPKNNPAKGVPVYTNSQAEHAMQKSPSQLKLTKRAPAEQIRAQPWSFVSLALTMGIAAGFLMRYKTARKALKFYLSARKLA
jgi:membrane protein